MCIEFLNSIFHVCVCVCECESVDTGDSRGNRQGEPQPTLGESGGVLLWISFGVCKKWYEAIFN